MRVLDTSPESMAEAVAALRAGLVIAYPTETLYGLGVDPFNEIALQRLFEAKGRDRDQPVLLIVSGGEQLARVARTISPRARACMDAFWPGPLSLLLPKVPGLPEAIAPGRDKICVRCPGNRWARALCDAFGGPVTSTSANPSGSAPVISPRLLDLPGVELGIDAGPLDSALPSTILDVETGAIVREGAISRRALERFLT